jgi:glycosyltransferase involved in cell wall biosynthesis
VAPSISVVIPYYNGARFVAEALDSVRAQTLAPLEVIVVDDGSRPDDAAALDRVATDCVVIHLPRNRGVSVARNTGIARARGDWIAFLDCDDLWEPRKLEVQAALVSATPGCRAVHCGLQASRPDGSMQAFPKEEVPFEGFLEFPLPVFPSATMMERNSLIECGLFDPTLAVCQDLDLCMRFARCVGPFHCVPEILVTRRVQPEGLSRNNATFWSDARRVYRDFEPLYDDPERARATLQGVHVDMALRAVYARDWALVRRIVRDATRPDVRFPVLLGRVIWSALRARLSR